MSDASIALKELNEVLDDLGILLKNPDVGAALAERGVNASLAIVAAEGLRAYIEGDKARAADDFDTVAEEIATRHALTRASKAGQTHVTPGKKDVS